jgi:hypothetical protein
LWRQGLHMYPQAGLHLILRSFITLPWSCLDYLRKAMSRCPVFNYYLFLQILYIP